MARGSMLERNVGALTASVSRLEKNVETLVESMSFVISNMATKEDVRDITRNIIREEVNPRLDKVESRLDKVEIKLDKVDTKLTKFEEGEIDKRKQLDVRVARLERKA